MWSTGGGNGKPPQYTCQMSQLGLEKEEELEIRSPTMAGLQKKQGNFRKTTISIALTTKTFDCVDHDKLESSQM